MKNQGENKNRNKFDCHLFIHFIADLIYVYILIWYMLIYFYIYIYILCLYIIYNIIYIHTYIISYMYKHLLKLQQSAQLEEQYNNDGLSNNYGMWFKVSWLCNHQANIWLLIWSQWLFNSSTAYYLFKLVNSHWLKINREMHAWWLHKHETLSGIL